jgi:hypothetical protein
MRGVLIGAAADAASAGSALATNLPGIIPSGLLARASGPSPASRLGPLRNLAHSNLDHVQVASTRQLTVRSGDQNDAVTVALDGDVSAIELYIGEITISGD